MSYHVLSPLQRLPVCRLLALLMEYLEAEQLQEGIDEAIRPGIALHRKLVEQVVFQPLLRSAGRAADGKSGFSSSTAR